MNAETVTPLSVRALADLGPTDISFAIDAGSLGRFGLVAENSTFVFGLAENTRTDAAKPLADQLRSKGAQLDFAIDTTSGTAAPVVQGGFGMGLALSRAFGESLQAIPEFAQTRIQGGLNIDQVDIDNGVTLPKVAMDFPQFPDGVSLRSLLMPQLDDFATFSIDNIIAMVDQAYEWVFGVAYTATAPTGSDITAELPFVGQSLNDLLPLHQVFKVVRDALTAQDDPDTAMQNTLLLLEAEVNKALVGVVGWDTPPVFGISFSTLPGNVWTSGVPHRALEISLNFDNAVATESALSLDLLQALGLADVPGMTSEVSAKVGASVAASGKLVFGGALREDASLDNLGSLEADTGLLTPFLYIDTSSELGLSFGIEATDVDVALGFTVNAGTADEISVAGGIEDGFIGLTNKAGDAPASLSFALTEQGADVDGPRFFVIGAPGYSAAANSAEVATVERITTAPADTHLARLTLDSVAVPGGSAQLVNITRADEISNDPDAADADYEALGRTQVGIVVSGATQFLVQETGVPGTATSSLSEGDTLQRVVSGAEYAVASTVRSGNLATLTFETVSENQPKAAWFDGMSHVLLEISDGSGGVLRLPLMLVLPDDLNSTSISVVLPSDILAHDWGSNVVVHGLAPLASLVDAPEVRTYDKVGFIYKVKLASADGDFTEIAKADDLEQASLTFGAGKVSARVIDVETASGGDILTLVLDSNDPAIQAVLGAGDATAVATLLDGLSVVKGTAPVFDASAIRPTLDAALSVDMTARADLVGLDLGRLRSTVELPAFAQLALEGANGIDDLFTLLKGATDAETVRPFRGWPELQLRCACHRRFGSAGAAQHVDARRTGRPSAHRDRGAAQGTGRWHLGAERRYPLRWSIAGRVDRTFDASGKGAGHTAIYE